MPRLAACPFCGCTQARFQRLWTLRWANGQSAPEGRVLCPDCGARTDTGSVENTATAWNRRP